MRRDAHDALFAQAEVALAFEQPVLGQNICSINDILCHFLIRGFVARLAVMPTKGREGRADIEIGPPFAASVGAVLVGGERGRRRTGTALFPFVTGTAIGPDWISPLLLEGWHAGQSWVAVLAPRSQLLPMIGTPVDVHAFTGFGRGRGDLKHSPQNLVERIHEAGHVREVVPALDLRLDGKVIKARQGTSVVHVKVLREVNREDHHGPAFQMLLGLPILLPVVLDGGDLEFDIRGGLENLGGRGSARGEEEEQTGPNHGARRNGCTTALGQSPQSPPELRFLCGLSLSKESFGVHIWGRLVRKKKLTARTR